MFIPPPCGGRGLERLIYYIVLKWQITFMCMLVCVNAYTLCSAI